MARLRNKATGSVVNVTDEKASRLGSEWESAEKPKPGAKSESKTDKKSD